ncbi:hypothetical protein TNCV_18301 [Trichonephila clavipes]|nr:hypothetical protein TNCV_18301 [Trichonephila clavipes]
MECHSELVEVLGNYALKYRTVARWENIIFENKLYKQIKGLPQGGPASNSLSNLYLHHYEIVRRKEPSCLLLRYIDDLIVIGGVGSSGSKRYHFLEDQAPGQTSRGENRLIVRNARVQPTVSLATIQDKAATSLKASVSSQTIRRRLVEGHLDFGAHYVRCP